MVREFGRAWCLTILTLGACAAVVVAQEPLKSGPQFGKYMPGLFNALIVNGRFAEKQVSVVQLVRGYEKPRPYWIIFVRGSDDATLTLIKKLDEEQAKTEKFRVGVVFLSDDPKMADKLAKMVEKEKIRAATISTYTYDPDGPEKWIIAKEAAITVVLFNTRQEVLANFAFRKGELDDKQVDRIIKTATILDKKE